MGYRSQVAYWFKGKNAAAVVMQHMTEHLNQECFNELTITDDGVYFECEDCKWYDSYGDVMWHNQLFSLAETVEAEDVNTYADLCGQFVRVGEDNGDIEEHSFGDDVWDQPESIRVYTQMEYDFPTNQKEK